MDSGNSGFGQLGIREIGATISDLPDSWAEGSGTSILLPEQVLYNITPPSRQEQPKEKSPQRAIGSRTLILASIEEALKHIDLALDTRDPMERATEAHYLEMELEDLWKYRASREDEYKELVNLLIINLKRAVLENLPDSYLDAYRKIFDAILRRTIRKEDLDKALDMLEDNGINPFGVFSEQVKS